MNYFVVTTEPDLEKTFLERFSFFEELAVIANKDEFEASLGSIPTQAIFLNSLKQANSQTDKLVLAIREKRPLWKILFIVEGQSAHELKLHQLTPTGGDGYVDIKVGPDNLHELIIGLSSEEVVADEEEDESDVGFSDQSAFDELRNNTLSTNIDAIFASAIKGTQQKVLGASEATLTGINITNKDTNELGADMSDKDQELTLDDLDELELGDEGTTTSQPAADDGMELSLDDAELDLTSGTEATNTFADEGFELSLDDSDEADSGVSGSGLTQLQIDQISREQSRVMDLSNKNESTSLSISKIENLTGFDEELSLSDPTSVKNELASDETDLEFEEFEVTGVSIVSDGNDLSAEAKEKLKEIDEIMVKDSTLNSISIEDIPAEESIDVDLDEPLVSDDLNLDSFNFTNSDDEPTRVRTLNDDEATRIKSLSELNLEDDFIEEKPKKKKKENRDREHSAELREMSGAYSGELERTGATISNLRADRQELLSMIQKLEEDKLLHNRQTLSMRAELDEKKIELSIIRKKLNEEISELKDRLSLFDEKKQILEEKNRYLNQELDKVGQKNKIDVKKVQLRERELEQRLELLKSDAEAQIRNRDLKILELKRKIDSMEFDMESISQQEKRSVESRFELEDKLDKAIKTLRGAITVLEDESQRGTALEALKKNIDM